MAVSISLTSGGSPLALPVDSIGIVAVPKDSDDNDGARIFFKHGHEPYLGNDVIGYYIDVDQSVTEVGDLMNA